MTDDKLYEFFISHTKHERRRRRRSMAAKAEGHDTSLWTSLFMFRLTFHFKFEDSRHYITISWKHKAIKLFWRGGPWKKFTFVEKLFATLYQSAKFCIEDMTKTFRRWKHWKYKTFWRTLWQPRLPGTRRRIGDRAFSGTAPLAWNSLLTYSWNWNTRRSSLQTTRLAHNTLGKENIQSTLQFQYF